MRSDPNLEALLSTILDKKEEVSRFLDQRHAQGERHDPALKYQHTERTMTGMEDRVTKLETHFEYLRRDLDSINAKLDVVIERTANLPSRSDLTTFRWQWVATAVAAIALIVGGIIGGLGWLKPETPAPAIIQMPASDQQSKVSGAKGT